MARDWWEKGPPVSLSEGQPVLSGANHTTDYSTGTVTSEIVSTNVLTRSVIVPTVTHAQSSGQSTGFQVWTPSIPITVATLTYYPIGGPVFAASSSGLTLSVFNNACSLIASVGLATTQLQGSAISLGTIASTGAHVTAGTSLTFGIAVSTCDQVPAGSLQIDYTTTG